MAIKPSAASEIRTLTAALASPDDVTRESAVARLAILGPRAVDRVTAAYAAASRETRAAILRVLEAIADPRGVAVARQALREGGDVGLAGASALRALLDSPVTSAATAAFDALVEAAMDPSMERRVRLAAFDALQDMPGGVRERVAAALHADGDPRLQAGLVQTPRDAAAAESLWRDAADGDPGDSPSALREALTTRGASAALGVMQKMIDAVRTREAAVASRPQREAWRTVRGALHQALALRGSTVAVYDLRETLEDAAEPLPATFLTALHVVGDQSCLEPIAAACSRTTDARWRQQLTAAFDAIAKREKITARHPAMKRIAARWPDAAALSTTSRTRPRATTRRRT
ncbi:MAG: hypothetical protein WEB50_01195 [Vicinamibacterales bacterium]